MRVRGPRPAKGSFKGFYRVLGFAAGSGLRVDALGFRARIDGLD